MSRSCKHSEQKRRSKRWIRSRGRERSRDTSQPSKAVISCQAAPQIQLFIKHAYYDFACPQMSAGSDTLHLAYVSEEVVGDTNGINAINSTQSKPQDGETEILDESSHIVEPSTSTIQNGLSQSTSAQSMPPSNDVRPKKKPPRRATAESPNVCFECKTTDSKLWRRGPDGQ